MEVCELSGSCLECHFARCVYDRPWGKRQKLKNRRDRKVLRLFHCGKDTKELARGFGVSRRTVQRILKRKYEALNIHKSSIINHDLRFTIKE